MFDWIDDKHRLVVMNDKTFQEERSYRLTPFNVLIVIASIFMVISLFTILLMIYTPLGNLVPKENDLEIRGKISEMYILLDSLERSAELQDIYIHKIESLVFENFEYENDVIKEEQSKQKNKVKGEKNVAKSKELEELIERVENESELGNLVASTVIEDASVNAILFNAPIRGIVSDTFAPHRGHFGTDIVAPKGELIKAAKKGTVIVSTWSAATGYMIGIQHDNNTISFYKHNSTLLKKEGDIVRAGEGIAIIGNTGEMTDGPHLHFELWFNGQAINAQKYISFGN